MPTKPPVLRPAHLPSRPAPRQQNFSGRHDYGRDWRKVRLVALAAEPLCRFCMERGLVTAATEVDHIETVAARPDLRLVLSNLRPLCTPCHSRRTATEQRR